MNKEDLDKILADHALWVNSSGEQGKMAELCGADLQHADLQYADLRRAKFQDADLRRAKFEGARLEGAIGFRFDDAPDPIELRRKVADQIEQHPELHNQSSWGDGTPTDCGTPCCVAGWACRLGGGTRGMSVDQAAIRLLWVDGKPMPRFDSTASRDQILTALRA